MVIAVGKYLLFLKVDTNFGFSFAEVKKMYLVLRRVTFNLLLHSH